MPGDRTGQEHPALQPVVVDDEERLAVEAHRLASKYGRYGYRMVTGLLREDGWRVNHKRVERIWRAEGLKVPRSSPSGVAYG